MRLLFVTLGGSLGLLLEAFLYSLVRRTGWRLGSWRSWRVLGRCSWRGISPRRPGAPWTTLPLSGAEVGGVTLRPLRPWERLMVALSHAASPHLESAERVREV